MATISARGNSWQVNLMRDGKRIRQSFKTYETAQEFVSGADVIVSTMYSDNLKDFSTAVFDTLWGDIKHPQEVRGHIKKLVDYFGTEFPIPDLGHSQIDRFVQVQKTNNLSGATINRTLSTLSKLLKYAYRVEVITKLPEITYCKESKGRELILSPHMRYALISHFRTRRMGWAYNILQFFLATGCRTSELFSVLDEDITRETITFRDTKNGSTRVIPTPRKAYAAYLNMKRLNGVALQYPFINYKQKWKGAWKIARDTLGYADNPEFVPHMLRHTVASRLVRNGVGLPQVMQWMGHKSITTTMRYAHLAPDDLINARAIMDGNN